MRSLSQCSIRAETLGLSSFLGFAGWQHREAHDRETGTAGTFAESPRSQMKHNDLAHVTVEAQSPRYMCTWKGL